MLEYFRAVESLAQYHHRMEGLIYVKTYAMEPHSGVLVRIHLQGQIILCAVSPE